MTRPWLVVAALLAAIAGPAFAADMPLKAPPPPAPVAAGWNGFYIGAQVGEKWSKGDWDPTCIQTGALAPCGSAINRLVDFPGAPDSTATFNTSGLRYGLYYGWMFQAYDRWVFGAESDYAFHNKTGTVNGLVGCVTDACTGGAAPNSPGPFSGDSTSLKFGDDYSFRVRAGFLVTPDILLYGTGGAAAQKVAATVTCNTNGAAGCNFVLPVTSGSSTVTDTLVGYTVGAGIEWKVWDHILLRGEYRYNDYGTWKQSATIPNQIQEFANVHVKTQMATFGIAWLFPPPRW